MISGYDHVAITVADLNVSVPFYERVLGATVHHTHELDGRVIVKGIRIGRAAMNMHQAGNGVDLVARTPLPGSQDLCFRWEGTVEEAKAQLEAAGVEVIEGPSPRNASDDSPASSVYFRDPDGNLLELLALV